METCLVISRVWSSVRRDIGDEKVTRSDSKQPYSSDGTFQVSFTRLHKLSRVKACIYVNHQAR